MIEFIENLNLISSFKEIVRKHPGWLELRYQKRIMNGFTVKNGLLEDSSYSIKEGVGVRVLVNGTWGFSSTSNLDNLSIGEAIKNAVHSAKAISKLKKKGIGKLPVANFGNGIYQCTADGYLEMIPVSEKIRLLLDTEKYLKKLSKKIIVSLVKYSEIVDYKVIINSDGAEAVIYDSKPEFRTYCVIGDKSKNSTYSKSIGITGGWNDFLNKVDPEKYSEETVRKATDLLNAPHPDGGTFDVILSPDLVGLLCHEAIGHTVEADFVLSGSITKDLLNKKVASPLVTMIDTGESLFKPHAGGEILVDDEGVVTKPVYIIKDGILRSYLHNRESAKIFSVEPTGNSRAYTFSDEPLIRMRNTCIAPGKSNLKEMISEIKNGFYLTGAGSGQADSNAEFMFGVDEVYEIKNGKKGKLHKGATISGQAFEVLKSITHVSKDFEWALGSGYCGKGQAAKVDAGGPYVKCKITIGGRTNE
ncbi:MAG: TldD/PmbA family protein [bacterium]|nr:TldD/PmbA family protein [bacterium]